MELLSDPEPGRKIISEESEIFVTTKMPIGTSEKENSVSMLKQEIN